VIWRHYVYEHVRLDTDEVFYVGKGAFRKNRKPLYERANTKNRSNRRWKAMAAHGYRVDIIAHFQTDDDACQFEIARILERGRDNLVNATDGGDGRRNGVFSQAERIKRSENAKRKRSAAWVASIRAARKNGGNGGVVKRGDKLPAWWKDRIAKAKVGSLNPMYGKTGDAHHRSRFVVDAANGIRYPSITAAAVAEGMTVQNLHGMLTGNRKNRTTLRLIHGA
jgi:hypothetical protein